MIMLIKSILAGSVRLADLNDYVNMGASCIYDKPADKAEKPEEKKSKVDHRFVA
jgi:hypothetical protein